MSGKVFPETDRRLSFRLCAFVTALFLHGCLQQSKPLASPSPPPSPPAQATLITETLAEVETLRTTMAAERIRAAKQTANFRAVQNRASALRNREIEHMKTISTLKKELATVKTERDELQKEVADLRTQAKNLPQLLEMVAHVRILETSLKGMVSSIDALSNETTQLKKQIAQQRAPVVTTQKSIPSGQAEHELHTEDGDFIVVTRGDSLWRLAHRYGTTVAELKTLNDLDRDLILVGQLLKIPSPAQSLDKPDPGESLKAKTQPHDE